MDNGQWTMDNGMMREWISGTRAVFFPDGSGLFNEVL
jgi:hypothetical protein